MGIELFREAFQQTTSRGVFFDNASMGPVAPCVTEAMNACMKLRQTMPMKYYRFAEEVFSSCKSLLAELMGASPEEIAFYGERDLRHQLCRRFLAASSRR